jgi:leucyl-tRNA synthetase
LIEIERKWQKRWRDSNIFEAEPDGKKFFVTFPYPYVNAPPHIGHTYSAIRVDMVARFKRMLGYTSLFPQGWHLTGEPLMGAAKRVAAKDSDQIEIFRRSHVPDNTIATFKDPEKMAYYFIKEWNRLFREAGFSIDWRRTFYTTVLNRCYSAFVKWQFTRLKEMGYIGKGIHPVIYCPSCDSPTGSHDRLKGENATILEYMVVKFRCGDFILPAATLRPETTYGVTNMWVNPKIDYVKADVDGETWIMSEEAFTKMKDQEYKIQKTGKVKGEKLIGKLCINPINGKEIPTFPASFVKSENGTGIVMSVPSHAPYDHIALTDLKKGLEYIHLIDTPGFSRNPAIEVCTSMGIASQSDPKLEQATNTVYRNEFHKGVMNEVCGKFAGRKVSEAKEEIVGHFEKKGWTSKLYFTSEPVVCRCTTPNHVKMIKDQWFIRYSDPKWKKRAMKCLSKMEIYPDEARQWFENSINNMIDKACARKSGLGTPLPWEKDWIIEPLSDSTVYMAYYIVAKYVNERIVDESNLTEEFFDYVFLGRKANIKKTGLPKKMLDKIKAEFNHFYPVDLRGSGKDLVPHHLCFFIYNHVALFPESKWPKSISVNGWVKNEGQKMSKSLGNFLPLSDVLEKFGADAFRVSILDTAEGLDDPDFRAENARAFLRKSKKILAVADSVSGMNSYKERTIDRWLLAMVQQRIRHTTEFLEEIMNRHALQHAFHGMLGDITKYLSKTDKPDRKTMEYSMEAFAKLLVPFAPHLAEEIHSKFHKTLVHRSKWPKVVKKYVDESVVIGENYLDSVAKDINHITKLVGKKPKSMKLIVSADWKYSLVAAVKSHLDKGTPFNTVMKEIMGDERFRRKETSGIVQSLLKDPSKVPDNIISSKEEALLLRSMSYEAQIHVEHEGKSKEPKARNAMPGKPAIVVII